MLTAPQVVSGLTVKIADLGNACWVRVVPPNYFNLNQNNLLHTTLSGPPSFHRGHPDQAVQKP